MPEEDKYKPAGGLPGKIFVPRSHGPRKHPCPECFECQWCPDSRCAACRRECGNCAEEATVPDAGESDS